MDHCVPRPFARLLLGHEVSTARAAGLDNVSNGKLLASAAAAAFDVLITVDGSLSKQQSKSDLPLPVVLIIAYGCKIDDLAPLAPEVLKLLGQQLQKRVYLLDGRGGQ